MQIRPGDGGEQQRRRRDEERQPRQDELVLGAQYAEQTDDVPEQCDRHQRDERTHDGGHPRSDSSTGSATPGSYTEGTLRHPQAATPWTPVLCVPARLLW